MNSEIRDATIAIHRAEIRAVLRIRQTQEQMEASMAEELGVVDQATARAQVKGLKANCL